jgi:hypothetical protein
LDVQRHQIGETVECGNSDAFAMPRARQSFQQALGSRRDHCDAEGAQFGIVPGGDIATRTLGGDGIEAVMP